MLDNSSPAIALLKTSLDPVIVALSLFGIAYLMEGEVTGLMFCVGVTTLLLAGHLIDSGFLFLRGRRLADELLSFFAGWMLLLVITYGIGYFSGFGQLVNLNVILVWAFACPVITLGLHGALYGYVRFSSNARSAAVKPSIIVCANQSGRALSAAISRQPLLRLNFLGFFDDRPSETLGVASSSVVGRIEDVAEFVRKYGVARIYITLPMTSQPRILALLDALKDTTASIYFVPDMFVFDPIQARFDDVGGVPVISVCESPFEGTNGIAKRVTDVVLAFTILGFIWPLLAGIAVAVKLTSAGPAVFKQRRYGLDGREIIVYKFRTMTVMEDDDTVSQATRNDARLTAIGGLLRRTSLDELPQFVNVLQGRMSVVGPRPHATAHNERYRSLIKGYMVRHKVRPGITGWAQVKGARGETDTLEKMERRIGYDLEYLRNWSVWLDLKIVFFTVLIVLRSNQAY
ncbi:MAG: undecaprenyl-phosphate glucose phosphotransferase [Marinobacter sp.]